MLKYLKKTLIYFIIFLLSTTLLITIIDYFNLLNEQIINILKLIFSITSIFIPSYILGTNCVKKGYIEGLKFGSIIILLFIIISIITNKFHISSLIYYLILLLTSTLGSMIGINKKKAAN